MSATILCQLHACANKRLRALSIFRDRAPFATQHGAAGRHRAKRAHVARRHGIARWKRLSVSYNSVPVARLRRLAFARPVNFCILPRFLIHKRIARSTPYSFFAARLAWRKIFAHGICSANSSGEASPRGAAPRKARAPRAAPHDSLLEAP